VITDLYFGTYGDTAPYATFVEVGVYDGAWTDGSYYHGFFTGRHGQTYHLQIMLQGISASVGDYVTFQVAKTSSGVVKAKATNQSGAQTSHNWGDAGGPYVDWQTGIEFSCRGSAHAAAHVYDNRYRRSSDGLWLNPASGTIQHYPSLWSFGFVQWCSQPVTFDVFIPSSSDPNCI
jgi:hypothetical protein